MRSRGISLSIEALFSLLFLALILTVPVPQPQPTLHNLQMLQKQHDLLSLWLADGSLDETIIRDDFAFAFPNSTGTVNFCGTEISTGRARPRNSAAAVSSSALYLSPAMQLCEITLTVFR
ncbi:MAG: hypothetical protein ABH854_03940 [Candidatus Diapherotrites archaeon]|nr:hypothetical protein [Candidatus Micrarchaeota archaeon]MBU1939402.1 hypothetical protein [Candidatus Micrarchaeota archaeon]